MKPRGIVTRTNKPKSAYLKVGEPQIEIATWCPDEKAEQPPEQVHFIIHWPAQLSDLPPLVLRFKSPDTLGFFIEELNRYRNAVWPDAEKVNLTQEPHQ
jgi:hypothetical protein